MSEAAKNARRANRDKAKRLTSQTTGKVDASDWESPKPPMRADKKTGMRPVSPRTYKHGGRVQGDRNPVRADKSKRGNPPEVDAKINRNVKDANAEKFGAPHIGGLKKGGRAEKCGGGRMGRADGGKTPKPVNAGTSQGYSEEAVNKEIAKDKSIGGREAAQIHRLLKGRYKDGGSVAGGERPKGGRIPRKDGGRASDNYSGGLSTKGLDWRQNKAKTGYAWHDGDKQVSGLFTDKDDGNKAAATLRDRTARKDGGRAKGKTNINIIVNPGKQAETQQPMPGPVRPPPPPAPPPAPPPQMPAPAPMPPMPGAPGAPPAPPASMLAGHMPRKRGGRAFMNQKGGAGGGLGRLEKANLA